MPTLNPSIFSYPSNRLATVQPVISTTNSQALSFRKRVRINRLNLDRYITIFAVSLILLASVGGAAYAQQTSSAPNYTMKSTSLLVSGDGSTEVNQTLTLAQNVTSVALPLFSKQVGNVLAVTQDGSPVSYSINGGNITLYTLGATQVSFSYDTDALTTKQGTVWEMTFTSLFNTSLTLPFQSTLLSFSTTPTSLSTVNGSPSLVLSAGSWQVSYGLSLVDSTSTKTSTTSTAATVTTTRSGVITSTSSTQGGVPTSSPTALASPLGIAAILGSAALVAVAAALVKKGGMGGGGVSAALRFDDKEILRFVKEKGGRAIEAEIRERFSIPRTSAWRQARRLEKLGFVKISKLGTQNQVELVKGDFEGRR
jgi:uncharacterized membrane protein